MNRPCLPLQRLLRQLPRLVLLCASGALAAPPLPYLPPDAEIGRIDRIIRQSPELRAGENLLAAEQANRRRLEAGEHEWTLRLGGQRRRSTPDAAPAEGFGEWNAALERPWRLPGKADADAELGAAGVGVAEAAQRSALHAQRRLLLTAWFQWLKADALSTQWTTEAGLLAQQAEAIRKRRKAGDAARLEQVQAEAALAQAEAQAAQARARQENAALELSRRFPGLPLEPPRETVDPLPLEGTAQSWIDRIVAASPEVGLARSEARQAEIGATRAGRNRRPDPTLGFQVSRERGGEETVIGAYLSFPLPGEGRRAGADGAAALAAAAGQREAAAIRQADIEAARLHQSAAAAFAAWQASHAAAERLAQAGEMSARAHALGESSLAELLAARRLANEARQAARLARLEAFELRYRLQLEARALWPDEATLADTRTAQ